MQGEENRPRARVTVPHSLAIPELLRDTDMLSIVPASLALALAKSSDLLRRQPPYQAGSSVIRAVWHSRDEHEAGHAWLRERVAATAKVAEDALA